MQRLKIFRIGFLATSLCLLLTVVQPAATAESASRSNLSSPSAERLRVEDAVLDGFVSSVSERWPNEFAGLWLASDGTPTVYVAFTQRAEEIVDALRTELPFPNALRPVRLRYSLTDLETLQNKMISDRSDLQVGRGEGKLPEGIAKTNGQYDLDIDVPANRVVVHLAKLDTEQTSAFTKEYGAERLVFRAGLVQPDCSRTNCGTSMRGGLRITTPHENPGYVYVCSTAFGTYQGSGLTRAYQVLTAGHCGEGGPDVWSHASVPYGASDYLDSRTYGRLDAKVIPNTNLAFTTTNLVWISSSDQRSMSNYISWNDMALGVTVIKSGVTTGSTGGAIESKNYSPSYILNGEKFIKAGYCSEGGDSGGAVIRGNTAYGIHSGGSTLKCSDTGDFGVFGAVEFALQAFFVNLRTN